MPTQKEQKIIYLIGQIHDSTKKTNGKFISPRLYGNTKNRSAINSYRSACAIGFGNAIIQIISSIIYFMINNNAIYNSSFLILTFVLVGSFIVSLVLSIKSFSLKVTPAFALWTIIVNLCIAIACFFLSSGVFFWITALVSAIFQIIALCKYRSYKNWFYFLASIKNKKY